MKEKRDDGVIPLQLKQKRVVKSNVDAVWWENQKKKKEEEEEAKKSYMRNKH